MFQSLRQGSQVFVLHREGVPVLEMGSVVNVSIPMPKYQVPPVFGQGQDLVVDVTVKLNGQDTTYQKLPATAEIADFGPTGIVISDSKEAMNAEVISIKQNSIDHVNSKGFHEEVIARCDEILKDLNPEYAERKQQQEEINDLKTQLAELMKMNRDLMARLDSGATA